MSEQYWSEQSALVAELPPLDSELDLIATRVLSACEVFIALGAIAISNSPAMPLVSRIEDALQTQNVTRKVIKVEAEDEHSFLAETTSPSATTGGGSEPKIMVWVEDPADPTKLKKYRIKSSGAKPGDQIAISPISASPSVSPQTSPSSSDPPIDQCVRNVLTAQSPVPSPTGVSHSGTASLISPPTAAATRSKSARKSLPDKKVKRSSPSPVPNRRRSTNSNLSTTKTPPPATPSRQTPRRVKNEKSSSGARGSLALKKGALRNARSQKTEAPVLQMQLMNPLLIKKLAERCDFELPRKLRRQHKRPSGVFLFSPIKVEPVEEVEIDEDNDDVAEEFLAMLPDLMLPPLPVEERDVKPVIGFGGAVCHAIEANGSWSPAATDYYGPNVCMPDNCIPLASIDSAFEYIQIPSNPLRTPLSPEPKHRRPATAIAKYRRILPMAPNVPPRPLECLTCGQLCSSHGALLRHVAKLHGHTEKKLNCHLCGKSFHHNYRLQQHLIVHSGAQPFACQKCKRRFGDKNSLRAHYVRIHEALRNHKCPKCVMAFKSRRELELHVARIHDRRPRYFCDECPKQFMTTSDLRDHKLYMHSEGRPYHCNLCQADFKHPRRLKEHLRRMHDQKRPMVSGFNAVSTPDAAMLLWTGDM